MSKELHRKISEKATKFIMRHFNCPIGIVESTAAQSEFLDGYAANYHSSYIVEAKTSRKDFKRDFFEAVPRRYGAGGWQLPLLRVPAGAYPAGGFAA